MVYINIHCHHYEKIPGIIQVQNLFHSELEQAKINDDKFFSIGIHPWHTKEVDLNSALSKIGECAKLKNVVAIGECGLDKLKGADIETQKEIFISQTQISKKLQKPLIIHCVKALEEIVLLKKQLKPTVPWIIHGFRQNGEIAKRLVEAGFYLSFGIHLTKGNPELNSIFSNLPEGSFFLETDDEESSKINLVYESAAKTRNTTVEKIASIQNKNFIDCFKVTI
jgi:TatD DNase family protein